MGEWTISVRAIIEGLRETRAQSDRIVFEGRAATGQVDWGLTLSSRWFRAIIQLRATKALKKHSRVGLSLALLFNCEILVHLSDCCELCNELNEPEQTFAKTARAHRARQFQCLRKFRS
jgi:hypothetical protein